MMPSRQRRLQVRAMRPTPTTCATARLLFKRQRERAADQPDADHDELAYDLLPRDCARCAHSSSCRQRLRQRFEEARVLRFEPDRDAQMIRHAVAADRPHDHAALRAAAGTRRAPSLPEAHEIAVRRDIAQPERRQARVICFMPAWLSS